MEEFLSLKNVKEVNPHDIITITKHGSDGISDYWSSGENVIVDGVSEYSLFTKNEVTRKQTVLRWKEYGISWGVYNIFPADNATSEEPIITKTELEDISEKFLEKSNSAAIDSEPIIAEQTNLDSANNNIEKNEVSEMDNNTIENIENVKTGARKSSEAQAKAVKKYTDKFERINCRFEKGTLAKIKETGYSSANKFIIDAVNSALTSTPKLSNNIVEFQKLKQAVDNKGMAPEVFKKIADDLEYQEAFVGTLTVSKVLEIIQRNVR